ncbi:MAG: CAP domain-containing protein [Armatimonadota bacterium]|nr:CAP domain-containing protein [Armatimonadota bacterium]
MRQTWRLSIAAACLSSLIFLCAPLYAASYNERVVELVNTERIKAGVPPLAVNPQLAEAARRYALYLGEEGFFGHIAPDGSTLVTRNTNAGYRGAVWLGENIAGGFNSPEAAVAAWMDSLPHRSNILDPNFAEVGVSTAFVNGSPYGRYWVQEFGMQKGMLAVPKKLSDKDLLRAGKARALPASKRKGRVSAGGLHDKPAAGSFLNVNGEIPRITEISPKAAPHRGIVTITGEGFGASGTLRFGGLVAKVDSWTDTLITARVPDGAISSGVTVSNDSGVISRGVGFHVSTAATVTYASVKTP